MTDPSTTNEDFEERLLAAVAEEVSRPSADDLRQEMGSLAKRAAAILGPKTARDLWVAAAPSVRRGYREPPGKFLTDWDAMSRYQELRGGGKTAEEAAAMVHEEQGFSADPEAARRVLDRLLARERDSFPTK